MFVILDEVMSVINLDEEGLFYVYIEIFGIIAFSIVYRLEFKRFYVMYLYLVVDGLGCWLFKNFCCMSWNFDLMNFFIDNFCWLILLF